MFQATRRRLALWYTAVTAILLLLFASGVFFYVRSTLIERVDDTLNHVVEVVRRSLVIEPLNLHSEGGLLRVNIEASFRNNAATTEADRIDIEWFSPTGKLLWSTLSAPLQVPLRSTPNGETVRITPEKPPAAITQPPIASLPPISEPIVLRQVTQRIELGQQVLGYLRVSHPWFEVTKPSREFFVDLAVGTALMVGAVGAIGWFLSELAMQPIRESYQRLKQFTADASHELRSPIAVIQTNVQVALADPDPDPLIQQNHLRVVERLTRRLGRLVDDLLFLARQDSGSVQAQWLTVDLKLLLEEVIAEQQLLAREKEIAIALQPIEPTKESGMLTSSIASVSAESANQINVISGGSPVESFANGSRIATKLAHKSWAVVQGDRDQMFRLFTNLIGNAVKYTPSGGTVTLELQRIGRLNHAFLQVAITDTGIGIPPEALPQLFDRFYRVDPARSQASAKGSGLGLAIAQAIVQNHQGQIQITSILSQGTTVTVTLPLRQEAIKA